MRKPIFFVLLLFAALGASAQIQYPYILNPPTVAPSGSCAGPQIQVLGSNGHIYTCNNGTWGDATGGGGGSFTALTGDATSTSTGGATTVLGINGTLLSGLATGILKNTTTTGVPSIAAAGTDYVVPSGSVANLSNGTIGQIPYQSAANTTAFLSANTAVTDQVLVSHGSGAAGLAPTLSNAPALATTNMTGTCTSCTANAVPAANLTGATLASGVTASSLTSLGGGTVGTAAFVNTGTSGATIPLLNGANTWSSAQTFSTLSTATNGIQGGSSTVGLATSGNNVLRILAAGTINWSSTSAYTGTADTILARAGVGVMEVNNGTGAGSGGSFLAAAYESGGTKFTASGCTSISSTVGGASAGKFTIGGNSCTVVITINGATGLTAPNGWSCHANDETTAAGNTGLYFSTNNATTATLTVPLGAAASDVIDFNCMAY